MITQVKQGYKFINISVAIIDEEGNAIDPESVIVYCYKISQVDGSLNLDTNIEGTGIINLVKQDSQTGFYGASINIESLSDGEYIILYKTIMDSVTSITVNSLSIDLSKKQIEEVKIETDKIQSNIIDAKDAYKADISSLATSSDIATLNTLIIRILGLVQENFRIVNPVYDSNHLLTSATIKIYTSASDCNNDINSIADYSMVSTYNSEGEMTSYKVIKN